MRHSFSLRGYLSATATAVALALSVSTMCLLAQAPAQTWVFVTYTHVKPDMLHEWLDLQKNEVVPALKKADVRSRTVWQTALFGDVYEYVSVTPIEKFAQFDNPNPIARSLSPQAAARLQEKLRKCITGTHNYATLTLSDLSIPRDSKEPPKMATFSRVRVAPGKVQDYQNFIKTEILPVYKGKVDGYGVSRRIFGGNLSEFTTVTYYNKFADLDGGPLLTRLAGQEAAAKIQAKGVGLSTPVQSVVRRYVADLSF